MVSTAEVEENLAQAGELIARAAADNAQLAVLPENFAFMGMQEQDKIALREADGDGPIQHFLSTAASQHNIWLVAGTIPLEAESPDRARAASLLYNDSGERIARYDKIHLFDVEIEGGERYCESDSLEAGDTVIVAATPFAKIGLSVCYDVRFPELYRNMHGAGVELITVPSAFTATTGRAHWEAFLRARAVENLSYVIAPNQGGRHVNGRETWGHSLILDPWGKILAQIRSGPGVACADLDFDRLRELRLRFPTLSHRRLNYRLADQTLENQVSGAHNPA